MSDEEIETIIYDALIIKIAISGFSETTRKMTIKKSIAVYQAIIIVKYYNCLTVRMVNIIIASDYNTKNADYRKGNKYD